MATNMKEIELIKKRKDREPIIITQQGKNILEIEKMEKDMGTGICSINMENNTSEIFEMGEKQGSGILTFGDGHRF